MNYVSVAIYTMQKTKKNYLVTGGLGLIGSSIVNNFEGKFIVISRSDKNKNRISKKGVKLIIKPIQKITKKDLDGIDIIYHCASTITNHNVLTDPYLDVITNINGTIHILELCKDLKKKPKIIYFSTLQVYGNIYDETKKLINEESKTDPRALYPATKLCTESIIKLYSRLYNIEYIICRLTNVYSEFEDYKSSKKGVLNYMIMRALKGEDLFVYNGGNFRRDYIYLEDILDALKIIENKCNETYLLGYGKSVLFSELIDTILKLTNRRSKVIALDPPNFHNATGINNFHADITKIKSTGWKPKIDYKKGIKKIVERYKNIIQSS